MSALGALLMIVTGVAIMLWGLFLFYAWLPLLYGIVGLDIGLYIGRALTGEMGFITHGIAVAGAIGLALASYFLEPYRRILLGVSGGLLLGLALSEALGLEGRVLGSVLGIIGAVTGGIVVPRFFDMFIVVASASAGAAMIVSGVHLLFPTIGLLNGTGGFVLGRLLVLVLGLIGIFWQFSNIAKWARSGVIESEPSGAPRT